MENKPLNQRTAPSEQMSTFWYPKLCIPTRTFLQGGSASPGKVWLERDALLAVLCKCEALYPWPSCSWPLHIFLLSWRVTGHPWGIWSKMLATRDFHHRTIPKNAQTHATLPPPFLYHFTMEISDRSFSISDWIHFRGTYLANSFTGWLLFAVNFRKGSP